MRNEALDEVDCMSLTVIDCHRRGNDLAAGLDYLRAMPMIAMLSRELMHWIGWRANQQPAYLSQSAVMQ